MPKMPQTMSAIEITAEVIRGHLIGAGLDWDEAHYQMIARSIFSELGKNHHFLKWVAPENATQIDHPKEQTR